MKVREMFPLLALGALLLGGCGQQQTSFKADVQPIIKAKCQECHTPPGGEGYAKSGLALDSYDGLMKGTKFGPVVVAGDALSSTLVILVEGRADPSINMPHGDASLSKPEQETIAGWVNQGAKNN